MTLHLMTLHLWLADLANYSAQIAIIVGIGGAAPWLLRVNRPHAMLIYRQLLLAACVLLPLLQPWKHPVIESSGEVAVITSAGRIVSHSRGGPTLEEALAFLLAAGVLARFGWLATGLVRLRGRERRAERLTPLPPVIEDLQWSLGVRPAILLSAEVSGPVTFGVRDPVVLLPAQFLAMPPESQQAIACHEMAHIRRADWGYTIAEEIVRAVFWFHPCIWWLLGQIQLTREQAVDCEVIAITSSREQYIGALLAVARGRLQPDLAPAPSFLQKSHLSQRVALLVKGVSMSKQRLLSSLAAICGVLMVTARLAVLYFPISAPAQEVVKGEANLLHRAPIEYPAEAIAKGIQGTVVVEAKLDEKGVVTDAHVVSGPDALRKAALKSVLDWHYTGRAQSPVEIAIDFKTPLRQSTPPGVISGVTIGGVTGGVVGGIIGGLRPTAQAPESGRLKRIQFSGISPQLREALAGHLPVQEGDEVQPDTLSRVRQIVRDVDEHLDVRLSRSMNTEGVWEYSLQIVSTAPMETPASEAGVNRIRVGGNVQSTKQVYAPKPSYPPDAKQERIQGTVKLNVVIGKDGAVQSVQAISGHPLLVPTAVNAVSQWVYQTTLLNGNPVEVATVVDVNFTLSQ